MLLKGTKSGFFLDKERVFPLMSSFHKSPMGLLILVEGFKRNAWSNYFSIKLLCKLVTFLSRFTLFHQHLFLYCHFKQAQFCMKLWHMRSRGSNDQRIWPSKHFEEPDWQDQKKHSIRCRERIKAGCSLRNSFCITWRPLCGSDLVADCPENDTVGVSGQLVLPTTTAPSRLQSFVLLVGF